MLICQNATAGKIFDEIKSKSVLLKQTKGLGAAFKKTGADLGGMFKALGKSMKGIGKGIGGAGGSIKAALEIYLKT